VADLPKKKAAQKDGFREELPLVDLTPAKRLVQERYYLSGQSVARIDVGKDIATRRAVVIDDGQSSGASLANFRNDRVVQRVVMDIHLKAGGAQRRRDLLRVNTVISIAMAVFVEALTPVDGVPAMRAFFHMGFLSISDLGVFV